LHFEPPSIFFFTSCQRPKPLSLHSFTLFNFSLNYPLNLENPSSSTSITPAAAPPPNPVAPPPPNTFHLHSHALLSTTIYNLQSRSSSLHLKNLLPQTTIVSTLFRRPPPSCNHKGTFKSFQRHWIYHQGNQLKIFGIGFLNLGFFYITLIVINWLIEYAIEGPNDMFVLWNWLENCFKVTMWTENWSGWLATY